VKPWVKQKTLLCKKCGHFKSVHGKKGCRVCPCKEKP